MGVFQVISRLRVFKVIARVRVVELVGRMSIFKLVARMDIFELIPTASVWRRRAASVVRIHVVFVLAVAWSCVILVCCQV